MSLYAEWANDWAMPYPWRLIEVSSNSDTALGQWEITIALFGLSVNLVWEYADTPLKADLRDLMADDSWIEKSRVWLDYADYKAIKDDAEKWRAQQ